MAGSAIRHDELFDFNTFQQAIEEAKASTLDLANQLNKVATRTKETLAETLSQVSGKKMEIVPEKELSKLQALDKTLTELGYSASNSREIIAGINKVNLQAADSIASMEAEAKALTKQYKSLSEEERNNAEIGGKILKQLGEMKAATSQYNESVRNTAKSVATSGGSYQALSQELSRMKAELKAMPGAFDPATGKLNEANKEAVELAKQISQTDTSIKKMDKSMGDHFRNVGNYTETEVSLKQQLKEIVAEMARMKLAGEDNTEAYRNLAERAGELKDTLGDVAAEVKRVGSDTSTIEGLVGVFEGVAGAAGIATGAMELFGGQNDEVAESIRKLQAIQTILLSVQSLANTLQKESAAILLIVNTQEKMHLLYTQLQTAAESKNIIVRKAATIAQWALNAAMEANPAGLLIAIVAALAAGILLLTRSTSTYTKEQKELNEALKNQLDIQKETIEWVNKLDSQKVSNAEDALKLAQAQGKSNDELAKKEEAILLQRIKVAKDSKTLAEEDFKNNEFFTKRNIKNLGDLEDAYHSAQEGLANAKKGKDEDFIQQQQDELDILKTKLDQYKAFVENLNKAQIAAQEFYYKQGVRLTEEGLKDKQAAAEAQVIIAKAGSYAEYLAKRDSVIASANVELHNVNLTANQRLKIKVDTEEKLKSIDDEYRKTQLQKAKDTIDASLALSIEGSKSEFELKLASLDKQKNIDLSNHRLTLEQKRLIEAQYLQEVLKLKKDYLFKEKEDALNAEISLINARISLSRKGSQEEYQANVDLLEKQYELEVASINNSVMNEELKSSKLKEVWAKLQKDKEDIQNQKTSMNIDDVHDTERIRLENEQLINKRIVESHKTTEEEKEASAKKYNQLSMKLLDNEELRIQKKYDNGLLTEIEYNDAILNIAKQRADEELRIEQEKEARKQEIFQASTQALSQTLDAINQMNSDASEYRISLIEKEKEISIKNAGDNTAAKEQIEKQYNMKVVAEKRKQAKQEKQIALFQAGIGTANAVVNALQTKPFFPLGLAMAVLAGIMGGAQMLAIASKPLPQFRRGTMNAPEGPAIVNDQPGQEFREMIVSGNTAYIPTKRNQVVNLKKGDKVFPAMDTKRILQNAELSNIFQQQSLNSDLAVKLEAGRKLEVEHIMTNALLATRTNEDKIVNGIGKQLKDLPIEQNIWDDRGYRRSIRKGNTRINLHNDKNDKV